MDDKSCSIDILATKYPVNELGYGRIASRSFKCTSRGLREALETYAQMLKSKTRWVSSPELEINCGSDFRNRVVLRPEDVRPLCRLPRVR